MDINDAKRDAQKIQGGRVITDIPGMDDVWLRVRGLSSPAVVSARSRKLRKLGRKDRDANGQPTAEAEMRVFGEVLAEAVLLEWGNLTSKGVELPYDPALAMKYCTDPDYMPFADAVTWAANAVDRGNLEVTEDLKGNSQPPSSSPSGSAAGSSETTAS
jgi:hypothetical protein